MKRGDVTEVGGSRKIVFGWQILVTNVWQMFFGRISTSNVCVVCGFSILTSSILCFDVFF